MRVRDEVAFTYAATLGVSFLDGSGVCVCVPECVCVCVYVCECGVCVSDFYFPWDADPGMVDMVTVLCTELSFVLKKKILFQ